MSEMIPTVSGDVIGEISLVYLRLLLKYTQQGRRVRERVCGGNE
jgi:hypothetical protein